VKYCLKGNCDLSERALLHAIQRVGSGIPGIALKATFRDWMESLVWVVAQEVITIHKTNLG
jgi:hypothetical protein